MDMTDMRELMSVADEACIDCGSTLSFVFTKSQAVYEVCVECGREKKVVDPSRRDLVKIMGKRLRGSNGRRLFRAAIAHITGQPYPAYAASIAASGEAPLSHVIYHKLLYGNIYQGFMNVFHKLRDELIIPRIHKVYEDLGLWKDKSKPCRITIAVDCRYQKRAYSKGGRMNSLDGTVFCTEMLTGYVVAVANMHRDDPSGFRSSLGGGSFQQPSCELSLALC